MSKETGGPAFPQSGAISGAGDVWNSSELGGEGLTLRDYFAAKAMDAASRDSDGTLQGSCFETAEGIAEGIACRAYLLADAMLKVRNK